MTTTSTTEPDLSEASLALDGYVMDIIDEPLLSTCDRLDLAADIIDHAALVIRLAGRTPTGTHPTNAVCVDRLNAAIETVRNIARLAHDSGL